MRANNVFAPSPMRSILKCNFGRKSCAGETLRSFTSRINCATFPED